MQVRLDLLDVMFCLFGLVRQQYVTEPNMKPGKLFSTKDYEGCGALEEGAWAMRIAHALVLLHHTGR